jgi:hypothetical protein
MEGDVVEMQRLFDDRLASPFDRSPGWSLWEMGSYDAGFSQQNN